MKDPRTLALLVVVAHWIVAIVHLFLAAQVVPGPNKQVSGLGIVFLTAGHLAVAIAVWMLSETISGAVLLIFFLAAMAADVYEHFLHPAPNNVLMVAASSWTPWFDASVFALLALEILGCLLGILSLGRHPHPRTAKAA
jgi:hypothetical protein